MHSFWQTFYSVAVIPFLWLAFRVSALFNAKIRRGIAGRNGLFDRLRAGTADTGDGPRIWIHASSLGEFEQAKAIIAGLRERYRGLTLFVTFFSPSGFENSRDYPLADHVTYIPFDSQRNAAAFIDHLRPDLAVFVRYDLWPNHVWELARRSVPVWIVNATIRRLTVRRFPLVRSFHRSLYNGLDAILTVSASDAETFRRFDLSSPRIEIAGDTRFDQVSRRCLEARGARVLPGEIVRGKKVLIGGSCWSEDDAVLLPAFLRIRRSLPDAVLIHVPHEPTARQIGTIETSLRGKTSWCRLSSIDRYDGEPVIIVDSIGKLLPLYASASVAFIGGSFGKGIHNVLEAAVFGIPVVFGPQHQNSQEPLELVDMGGAFVVESEESAIRTIGHLLADPVSGAEAGRRSAQFVARHTGATERLLSRIDPVIRAKAARESLTESSI